MRNDFFTITFAALFILVAPGHGKAAAEIGDGLNLSGFVDTSYFSESNQETSSFSLDQVEIDISKDVEGSGGFRFDMQHVNGADGSTDSVLEQGYVYAYMGGTTLTAGKFNAPIGFELLDAPDMFQFSHAMVFDYGLPTNLTGAMVSGGTGFVDFSIYAVNGWDLISDDNKEKTIGGRIGFTPMEGANIGVSYISGKEGAPETTANLPVLDIDMTLELIENLTIGAEFNSGTYEGQSAVTPGDDATWTGFLLMGNYAFSDAVAVTLRYDSFHDQEGARFGNGIDETRTAITVSPSYLISEGFLILAEYRYLSSDQDTLVDTDGAGKDNQTEIAIEMTYSF